MCVRVYGGGWVDVFLFAASISSRGHLTSAGKHDLMQDCVTDLPSACVYFILYQLSSHGSCLSFKR